MNKLKGVGIQPSASEGCLERSESSDLSNIFIAVLNIIDLAKQLNGKSLLVGIPRQD